MNTSYAAYRDSLINVKSSTTSGYILDWSGHHTMEALRLLTYSEAEVLRADLKHNKYFVMSGIPEQHGVSIYYRYKPTNYCPHGIRLILRTSKYVARYRENNRHCNPEEEPTCSLIAVINPKVLSGIDDYVSCASSKDFERMKEQFNEICQNVSPMMGDSSCYTMRRVDACVNIVLHDLYEIVIADKNSGKMITPRMVIELMRMGDIPLHYKAYEGKKENVSVYLVSKSGVVNFYCKGDTLKPGYPTSIGEDIAKDIIRLEVQQLPQRVYRNFSPVDRLFDYAVDAVCNDEWNRKIVCDYYREVVGGGDWYRYSQIIGMLKNMRMREDKRQRLVWCVNAIKDSGSVYEAKMLFKDKNERTKFVNTLAELRKLGINGVCIPDDWGIMWIPNILECYLRQLNREGG